MALSPILAALQESYAEPAPPVKRPPAGPAPAPFPALPPRAARVAPPPPPPAPQRAPARAPHSARDNAARQGATERQAAGNAGAGPSDADLAATGAHDWRRDGQSGGGGDGQDSQEGLSAGGIGHGIDTEALLDLLPLGADSGIFEVLLPGGETLGVVTDVRAASASFLLTAGSDQLRSRLLQKRLELESGLKRRMNRPVRLAVL